MIKRIEELSMNAFPALSTVLVNGWILRFSKGYAKRANSVNPIYECSIDIKENIQLCDEMYQSKDLATIFKLTENEAAYRIDEILEQQGYSYEAKTNVMLKSIAVFQIANEDKQNAVVYKELNEDWLEAYVSMNKVNSKDASTLKQMLGNVTGDTYYACIIEAGEIIAVGLGVAERGYVGMFDIYVHHERRRQGLGTKIINSLINEAASNGCTHSYLQVIDDNEEAKALYQKLGYEKQYSYWYRVKKLKR